MGQTLESMEQDGKIKTWDNFLLNGGLNGKNHQWDWVDGSLVRRENIRTR